MKQRKFFLALTIIFVSFGFAYAKDKITKIELKVLPATAKVRPFETAIIKTEFYGSKKKKGLFGSLFGKNKSETTRVQSSDWKVSLRTKNSGWISKPFLFQKKGEKTKSGFENFIKQSLGAASSKDAILYTAPAKQGKYTIRITEGNLSKEISITVSNSAATSKELEVSNSTNYISSGKYSD